MIQQTNRHTDRQMPCTLYIKLKHVTISYHTVSNTCHNCIKQYTIECSYLQSISMVLPLVVAIIQDSTTSHTPVTLIPVFVCRE